MKSQSNSQLNDQVTPAETAEILRLAAQALADNPEEGDFVELGCYRGDTSVLLGKLLQKSPSQPLDRPVENPVENSQMPPSRTSQASPKHLWIYDSFSGLPEKTREDASGAGANFKAGELLVTKREVIEKLRKHGLKTASRLPEPTEPQAGAPQSSVIVKKAWFDDLGPDDLPEKIAFAFCDGDLYSSIKTSLNLVKTRLTEKGIIIAHDYNNPELPGSARAVDEFLRGNPDFRLKVHYTLAILTKKC